MNLQDVSTLKKSYRTKICIMDAFIDLMDTEDCHSIPVKAIVERSGITRGTFYQHFTNTDDLLSFIENNILEAFPSFAPDDVKIDFSEAPTTEECRPTKWELDIFEYYEIFSKQLGALLGPHGDNSFYHKLHECIRGNFHSFIAYYSFPSDSYQTYFEGLLPDVFLLLAREHMQNPIPGIDFRDLANIMCTFRIGIKYKKLGKPDLQQWLDSDSDETI